MTETRTFIDLLRKLKCSPWVTLLPAGLALCVSSAAAQTNANWPLVWSDEFTQPDGSSPSTSKWVLETGGGGWGNSESEYYTARTNNVRIENNQLVIEALQENYLGSSFTSGRMKTQGKASWTYGRIEARIKIPRGQGIWPAFWMLGTNIPSVGWPTCGEIDIMENIGKEPTLVHGTVHGPGYSGGNAVGGPASLPGNAVFADDFHVYAIEWTTNQIKWFVDGQQYFSVTPASLSGTWVFNQPQFILLNVAVGGKWPGYPDGTTVFPQRMTVDYVRVYAVSNAPPTQSGVLRNGNFETGSLSRWVGKDFCCANPQGGTITGTNGLVWDPNLNSNNTQNIRNPAVGAYSVKAFGNFNGGPNAPGFYQDIDALPGSVWTASIKARTQSPDYIRDSNHAVVEVSFLDGVGSVLAKYASPVFDTNMPVNTWVDLAVTNKTFPLTGVANLLRAPAGTVKARFEVTFSQELYQVGSIYFDEATLQEITSPALSASLVDSTNLQISFTTLPRVSYQVLYKPEIDDPSWSPVQSIPGDGSIKSVTYPASSASGFYTVRLF